MDVSILIYAGIKVSMSVKEDTEGLLQHLRLSAIRFKWRKCICTQDVYFIWTQYVNENFLLYTFCKIFILKRYLFFSLEIENLWAFAYTFPLKIDPSQFADDR